MVSERLRYVPVAPAMLDAFHALVQDPHVRRYLMDGQVLPREWSAARIRESVALFERDGVGLWLAYERTTDALVGFCGFVEFPALHPDPELVYALPERYAGRGYATEMARASIAHARQRGRLRDILTSVDEVNRASLRILEKLGFERCASRPGAFGPTLLLRLASACGPQMAVSGGSDTREPGNAAVLRNPRYVIAVPDLERSARYYRDVLGFDVREIGDPGWRFFVRDECFIMAGECPDALPAEQLGDHSYFAYVLVDGIDELYATVTARGAALIKPLRDEPWHMREFGIRTVDGHRIMFGRRLET